MAQKVKSAAQTAKSGAEGAAETVKSEVKKSAGKAAKKVPKAKKALKRTVSEIDAQAAGQTAVSILASCCQWKSWQCSCAAVSNRIVHFMLGGLLIASLIRTQCL